MLPRSRRTKSPALQALYPATPVILFFIMKKLSFSRLGSKAKRLICCVISCLFILLAGLFIIHTQKNSTPSTSVASSYAANGFKVQIPSGAMPQNSFRAAVIGNADFFPVLRVAIPPKARLAALLSPFGEGLDRDLLEAFAHDYGFSLEYFEVNSYGEASEMLKSDKVDLAAGFPGSFNFNISPDLLTGPGYAQVTPMLLRVGAKTKQKELMVSDPGLLETVPDSSNVPNSPALSDDVGDLVNYLEQGRAGYALVDNASLNMLRPLFPNLKTTTRKLNGTAYHHWVWRNDGSMYALSLQAFWNDAQTGVYLEDLRENYIGFMPKTQNRAQTEALIRGLEQELIQYHGAIAAAAREYNLDPLLLTAVMFQESHFKNAVSGNTGKGLMQLTESTAASLGVDPNDPHANIRGGAKYLRKIFDSLKDEDMSYWDKWFVTLAAYNQGPGHLADALSLAANINDGNCNWRAVKEAYLLLETEPYASKAKRGAVRGKHVVKYVQNIRYYYYVLNGLVVLDRPEAQHLTPLLAKTAWPGNTGIGTRPGS